MPYICLDRDGVINFDSDQYIKSPDEWCAIPGSLDAIAQLNRAGYKVFIVTNQSGIARGYYDISTLDLIHEKLSAELAAHGGSIEEIFFCPHHPDDRCVCRKPNPGMLHQLQAKYNLDLNEVYFVGDSHVDLHAAIQAGCKPLLVLTGKGQTVLDKYSEFENIPNFPNLARAVDYIISNERR